MNIDLIPTGDSPPESINVIIEVPLGGEPVKYEFDKKSGALFVDRILHTPMRYPANYGFVPHTLSPDGDPLDALVIARTPFVPGCGRATESYRQTASRRPALSSYSTASSRDTRTSASLLRAAVSALRNCWPACAPR